MLVITLGVAVSIVCYVASLALACQTSPHSVQKSVWRRVRSYPLNFIITTAPIFVALFHDKFDLGLWTGMKVACLTMMHLTGFLNTATYALQSRHRLALFSYAGTKPSRPSPGASLQPPTAHPNPRTTSGSFHVRVDDFPSIHEVDEWIHDAESWRTSEQDTDGCAEQRVEEVGALDRNGFANQRFEEVSHRAGLLDLVAAPYMQHVLNLREQMIANNLMRADDAHAAQSPPPRRSRLFRLESRFVQFIWGAHS